jgi:hypothetical protein
MTNNSPYGLLSETGSLILAQYAHELMTYFWEMALRAFTMHQAYLLTPLWFINSQMRSIQV